MRCRFGGGVVVAARRRPEVASCRFTRFYGVISMMATCKLMRKGFEKRKKHPKAGASLVETSFNACGQ